LTPEKYSRAGELFDKLVGLPPERQEDYLAAACGSDTDLREYIAELLRAEREAPESFLAHPAIQEAANLIAENAASDPVTGAQLGAYVIGKQIGAGGMGTVYEAQDLRLNRKVAVKILPPPFVGDPDRIQRFRQEARAASLLNHPNIVSIYDAELAQGRCYIATEFVEGSTLRHLAAEGPMDLEALIDIAIQVCSALSAAHQAGIVHRDIKPENVMLRPDGIIKVLDFGLAKLLDPSSGETGHPVDISNPTATMQTRPGSIAGTLQYLSPEQVMGKLATPRSDIFSLGVMLYELATGVRPFAGPTEGVVFSNILNQTPDHPSTLRPSIPRELDELIMRALEKDPELRFQTASDLRSALKLLLRGSQSGTNSAPPAVERRYRRTIALVAVGACVLLAVAFIVGQRISRTPSPSLTDKDTIVLADFTNTTGDPVFDGTLRQGLSAQLEQSPFLNLLSDQRIAQTLSLMSQPKDVRLTKELSREVCQRTASAATVEGSVSSLGSQYVLGLSAVNCHTGDLLAQEQVTTNRKEQVLKVLGDAARELRGKLGESLATMQKYDAPVENVTTPSLDALQAYTLGRHALVAKTDNIAAIPFFERAVSLDPNFAMAYLLLGVSHINLGEPTRAAESMRRAYELRERTSELEKLNISSYYQTLVTGNLEAALQVCQLWAQTYPRDDIPQVTLSMVYPELGEDDRALTAAQEALRLNPGGVITYGNLAYTYLLLNRLDEATAAEREALARNVDGPFIHFRLYAVDFLQHNTAGMEREAAGLTGKIGYEDLMLYYQSDTSAYHGDFAKARELTRRAVDSARRADKKEPAAGYGAEAAVRDALVGNMASAKQEARDALVLANGRDVEAYSAIALGLAGDSPQAARLASDLAKRFPEDTIVQFEYLPMIHAAHELRNGDAGHAVEELAAAVPYELGRSLSLSFGLYPIYLRGEAYLGARQGAPAAAEFQKILNHPGVVINEVISALAYLGLGRAYALAGDSAKAKTAYQDFFALWKDADPDIPILQQAKAEYAKLK
jgi:eukaryotic-like serine/threonine-protein kinase